MKCIIALILLVTTLQVEAQFYLPGSLSYADRAMMADQQFFNDSTPGKKWFVTRYTGISTSFLFSKSGNASILSVPLGMRLNRRLTNNLYAFGGLSIAPSYINFNPTFAPNNVKGFGQSNSFLQSNRLGLASRAELGLMYVNEAKTFSVSGSIGVERNSYPAFNLPQRNLAPPPPANTTQKF
ncbi:MAG: hypothetical protein V4725_19145 [Bacteroidota bacterium]